MQDDDGNVQKHKERMVTRGFTQKHGIEFNETFACVARMDTIITVLATAAQHKWPLFWALKSNIIKVGYLYHSRNMQV